MCIRDRLTTCDTVPCVSISHVHFDSNQHTPHANLPYSLVNLISLTSVQIHHVMFTLKKTGQVQKASLDPIASLEISQCQSVEISVVNFHSEITSIFAKIMNNVYINMTRIFCIGSKDIIYLSLIHI
eukprot:TRINITY_DN16039_c0_g1_i1.p1 TRINITY_DN16039_c0_g1~~TRINITY_DN16039_c0_g1_i1.p1  ORF type:complete len:136 (-),score=26.04 TRINITY_DN16039_c0_g1_i1:26-406(-)